MDTHSLFARLSTLFSHLSIEPPLTPLDEGFGSVVYESANDIIFRVGRTANAAAAYAKEQHLLPLLYAHLPVPVPRPIAYAAPTLDFPHGVIGYPKLPGVPLSPEHITHATQSALTAAIAKFLHSLHTLNMNVGLPEQPSHVERYTPLRDAVMPVLREHLTPHEYARVSAWWDVFLSDARLMRYPLVLIHGDFWYGNLLVDGAGQLCGVLDFENAALDDAAQDFAALRYLGDDFARDVIDHYQALGGAVGDDFLHRWQGRWEVREFDGIRWSILQQDADELHESIGKLRAGPIFG